jgi:hypothetical protein
MAAYKNHVLTVIRRSSRRRSIKNLDKHFTKEHREYEEEKMSSRVNLSAHMKKHPKARILQSVPYID